MKVKLLMVLVIKNLSASAGDIRDKGLIPELERSPGGGCGNPLQCSCLENPMDRGACKAAVHGVTKELDMTEMVDMHTHTRTWGIFRGQLMSTPGL